MAVAGCGGGTGQSSSGPAPTSGATSGTSKDGCHPGATINLVFWSWVPNIGIPTALYNRTHPGVCVHQEDVAAGSPQFVKLTDALKAGTGAPDIVQMGFSYIYQYVAMHGLVDLSKYGADSVKKDFPAYAWSGTQINGQVYAIPQDSSPSALMYNKVLLKKYHLTVPTTWDQLLQDGKKLHAEAPGVGITDFAPNDSNWMTLLTQAGAKPYVLNGRKLTIGLTSAPAMKFTQLWDQLVSEHLVTVIPDYDTQFYDALDNDKIVMWPTPAWMPGLFSPLAKKTEGQWVMAPLPQWAKGANVVGDTGGSPTSVTTQSKHPAAAAKFAMWLNTNLQAWREMVTPPSGLYPMDNVVKQQPWFLNQTIPLTGSQKLEKVYVAQGGSSLFKYQFGPLGQYASTALEDEMDKVGLGKITMTGAFQALQSQLVTYAKQQGFQVGG